MIDRKVKKEVLTVLGLCILWYSTSSGNNVITKVLLNEFPFPMTVTMVQLLSITTYSGPFFNVWSIRKFVDLSWPYYFKIIVPLALGKFIVSVLTHVSIWKVPVSYAHTGSYLFLFWKSITRKLSYEFNLIVCSFISVKATLPLFSVVLSRVILGEKQTCRVIEHYFGTQYHALFWFD